MAVAVGVSASLSLCSCSCFFFVLFNFHFVVVGLALQWKQLFSVVGEQLFALGALSTHAHTQTIQMHMHPVDFPTHTHA